MIDSLDLANQLPGVFDFRRRVYADLDKGCSVLCLVNECTPTKLLDDLITTELRVGDRWSARVELSGREPSTPLEVLSATLGIPPANSPRYDLGEYLREPALPDIIVLTGLNQLANGHDHWLSFLERWANVAHAIVSTEERYRRPPALLAFLTPSPQQALPQENTLLHHYWWWSLPSTLEMALLCRLRVEEALIAPNLLWREAILPIVVGNDLELLDFLWDDVFGDFDHIVSRLRSFAGHRGWTRQRLEQWGLRTFQRRRGSQRSLRLINPVERTLWLHGVLWNTPEYGTWLHSAALAAIDDFEALRYRIWHGQASLVLPLVNRLRIVAGREIEKRTSRLRSDRASAWTWTAADGSAPEWAPLLSALREVNDPALGQLIGKAEHGRQIRNALAHYDLIRYEDYERLASYDLL